MYTALLTAIVTWISANFELPPDYNHPNIKLVPAAQITSMRYNALMPTQQRALSSSQTKTTEHSNRREAVALYDKSIETIFLPDTWKGETAADLSVLVHEMVHHLQNKARKGYACGGAREELAYAAQDKWLKLFGRDLLSEFQVDAFTIKVMAACSF
jgi:uncharacterized protein DUF6647